MYFKTIISYVCITPVLLDEKEGDYSKVFLALNGVTFWNNFFYEMVEQNLTKNFQATCNFYLHIENMFQIYTVCCSIEILRFVQFDLKFFFQNLLMSLLIQVCKLAY